MFLKDDMRLRPANSALEVMQGALVLMMQRKAGGLLPLDLVLGFGELGRCCCSSCCWREDVHGKFSRGEEFTFQGTNHFSVAWQTSTMWFGTKYLAAVLFACEINGLSSHLILNPFSVKAFQ